MPFTPPSYFVSSLKWVSKSSTRHRGKTAPSSRRPDTDKKGGTVPLAISVRLSSRHPLLSGTQALRNQPFYFFIFLRNNPVLLKRVSTTCLHHENSPLFRTWGYIKQTPVEALRRPLAGGMSSEKLAGQPRGWLQSVTAARPSGWRPQDERLRSSETKVLGPEPRTCCPSTPRRTLQSLGPSLRYHLHLWTHTGLRTRVRELSLGSFWGNDTTPACDIGADGPAEPQEKSAPLSPPVYHLRAEVGQIFPRLSFISSAVLWTRIPWMHS